MFVSSVLINVLAIKINQLKDQIKLKSTNIYANNIRSIVPADQSNFLLGTGGPLFLFNRNTKKATQLTPACPAF